jgi:hypothetical protein
MSRFGNYLQSQKLAKAHLITAEDRFNRGDSMSRVMEQLLKSVREFQTCTNNLASIQFEKKRSRKERT